MSPDAAGPGGGLNLVHKPEFYDFNIVSDAGAADHVVDGWETPGCKISDGAGNVAGGCFVAAIGQPIPNKSDMTFELQSGDSLISFKFQVALIYR